MRRVRVAVLLGLVVLALLLVACESYSQTGGQSTSHQGASGGSVSVQIKTANGSIDEGIEVQGGSGLTLEADVTLFVESGTYKIELLGEDGEVTLSLEASDGQTVSGHGQMVVDLSEEASYHVTATEAENVEYTIVYTFR